MQPHRGDDDSPHRHQTRPHSHSRYPPPPPPAGGGSGSTNGSSRPFPSLHHLPPPVPSVGSPIYRDGPAHSPSGGHTDPQSWVSQSTMDRPSSSRSKGPWGGLGPSPRSESAVTRLPSLADYSHHRGSSAWEAPSPGSYAMSNTRGSGGLYAPSYRDSPPPRHSHLGTSTYDPYHDDDRVMSEGPASRPTPRGSIASQGVYSVGMASAPGNALVDNPPSPNESSAKHPAPSGGESDAGGGTPSAAGQKKKKRRVALSCAECAKRKQKCNRETPCQHCVARRVPELCVPYSRPTTPPGGRVKTELQGSLRSSPKDKKEGDRPSTAASSGPRPPSMLPTISVRVARLEAMVNAVINRVDGVEGKALRDWRINHAPATSPPPLIAEAPSNEDPDKAQDRPDTSSTRSRVDEWDNAAEGEDAAVGGLDRDTSTRNPLPQSMIVTAGPVPRGLDYHGTPAEQLQKLFEDCGVSPHKVPKLLRDLPPRDLADQLVEWFFEKVNYVRYPIDRHLFRAAYETVYSGTESAALVLALPLIFIVLALSIRVAPDDMVGPEDQKRTMSLRMYWNSKSAVMLASAVKAENVHLVETRICTGLYLVLMHERRLAEGWAEFRSALTTAQALGLHRDGTKLGLDPYVSEYRRRLWSYLIHADATYSCLLGRPTSIDENCVDTLPPSNLHLGDLKADKSAVPRPLSEPTFATYLILRRALGLIVAKMTNQFQRLQGQMSYREVEAVDEELRQFVRELPPAFRMLSPDKSWDGQMWYLPIHRYYIQTEVLHFTIILHRPWLLRKLRSSRYSRSRAACFDAAITDYKLRQEFKVDCPDFFETLLGGSFREFNAAMIAGISNILDPRAPHAVDMKLIVQAFMEQHPHDPKADEFSQKEAAIIHTLHRRAQEMEDRVSSGDRRPRLTDNTSFERSSKSMPAPPVPTPPATGGSGASSDGGRNVPLPAISPQSYMRASPHASMGPTPPGLGTSPEEDHPQRLLDHWLMSNASFGPGSDSTMNFNIGPYQPVQQPTPTSASTLGFGLPTPVSTYGDGLRLTETGNAAAGADQLQLAGYGGPAATSTAASTSTSASTGWMDPSLAAGTGWMMALGQANGFAHSALGLGTGVDGADASGLGVAASLGLPQAGSNTQYWNALIDGIVGGMPAYDAGPAATAL
ncbi:hypothetical protein IAU60_001782 [Kwoniella sp. DSM 27419]